MKYLWIIALVVGAFFVFEAWSRAPETLDPEPIVFQNDSLSLAAPRTEETPETPPPDPTLATALSTVAALTPPSPPPASSPPVPSSVNPPTPPEETVAPEPSTSAVAITDRLVSFGFRTPPQSRSIDTVVLHSSYNASGGTVYDLDKIIGQYERYGVGAHYLIDRGGQVWRLIAERDIAYHAGESKMPDGRKNVNDFSIGIELIATEDSGFTEEQYTTVNELIADIKTRHDIEDIVGHGDIAPKRKTDPWKFDWKKLK